MHKLVVVLRSGEAGAALEQGWGERFVPRAERMPGLRKVVVSRPVGAPGGEVQVVLLHELFFDDLESLRSAMVSPEGQAAGRALMDLAPGQVELFFAEHLEMDLAPSTGGAA